MIAKINLKQITNSLNPLRNSYSKSFKIILKKEVVDTLNETLRNARTKKIISWNDFANIVRFLEKVDLKHSLTIFAQQVIKNNKKETIDILVLIKLLSSLVAFNPKSFGDKKLSMNVYLAMKKIIIYFVDNKLNQFSSQIKKLLNTENYSQEQSLIENLKIDLVRSFYWNKTIAISAFIQNILEKYVQVPQNIVREINTYEVLFKEQLVYFKSKKGSSIKAYISYDDLTKEIVLHYNNIKQLTSFIKDFEVQNYLNHISETSKYMRLSDLPPITVTQIFGLIFSYLLLAFWAIIILTPLIQMITLSFDGAGGNILGTISPAGDQGALFHYRNLFENTLFTSWLSNSLIVAFSTMLITIIFTTLLAYAFSRFRFPGRRSSILSIMILQMLPSVAALISFLVLKQLTNLPVNVFLIIIYSGGALTGNTFILRSYIDAIPFDLDEAAKIDGASTFKIFFSIIVPLAKPMIAIVALWSFIGPFGDVILPRLLVLSNNPEQLTMASGLRTLISGSNNTFQYTFIAGAIITSVPLTAMFMIAQKFLVSGLTKGAVK